MMTTASQVCAFPRRERSARRRASRARPSGIARVSMPDGNAGAPVPQRDRGVGSRVSSRRGETFGAYDPENFPRPPGPRPGWGPLVDEAFRHHVSVVGFLLRGRRIPDRVGPSAARPGKAGTRMKLAEALSLRSDAQKRLAQVQARAVACARYQEGSAPAEDPAALHTEALAVVDEIEQLVRRINRTNASTELEPGLTITDAIARRDSLAAKRKLTVALADAASGSDGEFGWSARQLRSELRDLTDLPVPELRQQADRLARDYRELDTRLQEANWATELVD